MATSQSRSDLVPDRACAGGCGRMLHPGISDAPVWCMYCEPPVDVPAPFRMPGVQQIEAMVAMRDKNAALTIRTMLKEEDEWVYFDLIYAAFEAGVHYGRGL